jgi:CubicO group peptidase (beta-lactamase class C family)
MAPHANWGGLRPLWPVVLAGVVLAVLTLGVSACTSGATPSSASSSTSSTAGSSSAAAVSAAASSSAVPSATAQGQASAITDIVKNAMATGHLRSVIIKVSQGDHVLTRQAFGTSMDGVAAGADMHFPNGNVAFSYVGTLLLQFVDEHKVGIDDTIDHWMPNLPEANKVTLKMLANHTSGYRDYVAEPTWVAAEQADPFHIWTLPELLPYAFIHPVLFPPGTNWAYSHTNFMILGDILAKIGGQPLGTLLSQRVLGPMGLTNTLDNQTSDVPSPVLHAYTSERREALAIPAATAFTEDSTFWNKQWGTPVGANETTTIDDMATSAAKVGTGALLSKAGYQAMTGPSLLNFGKADPSCAPACREMTTELNFGLGVVRTGSWLVQAPSLGGYSESMAYLPSQNIAIAVVTTFLPTAYDAHGNNASSADPIFRSVGALLAPTDRPPPTG